ncbi:major tail protein [Sediminibacillus halophilus]|uniref:Phage major tail protein, phi13 family n=1 Tax=Sediminibacillus halophilus TaxID=482461 RepID=A0A1G9QUP1_9BACI|nr:major tail protein [Sediminibacillus halophilus]SDM14708.1 phage major tail protein, phi13 family [Sediminibacillus halophilus]
MAEEVKTYRSSTGVDEFYYAEIDESSENVTNGIIERIQFLQNITVDMPQSAVRAFGDNVTAELAVSSGNITVTSGFHTLPGADKKRLLGLETSNGLTAHGSEDTPPYVACVFAKTYEDGSKEWVGLTKGIFLRPSINGQTKQTETTFSTEEISAEFMDRKVDGFEQEKSVIFGKDAKGETTNRDALFQAVFGKPYPSTTTTTTTTTSA